MRVRLAELIAMISLGTDLGMGQPMEHVMRQSLIALRLAERLGLDDESRAVVYYVGLIAWVGCHVDAYEQAKWFGDDQALKNLARPPAAEDPAVSRAAGSQAHAGALGREPTLGCPSCQDVDRRIGGTMDLEDIHRLRGQGFTVTRRGYDHREVDRFLDSLVEWVETDAAKDLGDQAVKRKLELVGKSTAQILLTTEKESELLRSQTEEECAKLRAEAEDASLAVRHEADEYATKAREKADHDARRTGEVAGAKAKAIVEEAQRRREQIEAVIAELDARRDGTLRELEQLRRELASTIGEHTSTARPHGRSGETNGERTDKKSARAVAEPS